MYASSYEPEFCKAFRDSLDALDVEPFEDAVKKMADRVSEAVVDRVHDDVRDRLISSINDSICQHAGEVAMRYLEEALAGDDKQIRNLLGLYDHQTAYQFTRWSPRPTRWLLIEAMMERRPDLFVDERIRLLNGQIEEQEREIVQWRERATKAETELIRQF